MNTIKILLIFLAFFLTLCFILMNVYNSKNNSKDNINENFYSTTDDINNLKQKCEDLQKQIQDINQTFVNNINNINDSISKLQNQLKDGLEGRVKYLEDYLKT